MVARKAALPVIWMIGAFTILAAINLGWIPSGTASSIVYITGFAVLCYQVAGPKTEIYVPREPDIPFATLEPGTQDFSSRKSERQ